MRTTNYYLLFVSLSYGGDIIIINTPQVEGAMNSRAVMTAVSDKWRLLDEQEETK